MSDSLLNLQLPFNLAPNASSAPARDRAVATKAPTHEVMARVHLPSVKRQKALGDAAAASCNELLDIAKEAQGMAELALMAYDADRLCSWLEPPQRQALMEYLRALNLLAVEAHLRATGRLPHAPGPLPIRRLCAYLLLFREALPCFRQRLRMNTYEDLYQPPSPAAMDDNQPSLSTMADVKASIDGVFRG